MRLTLLIVWCCLSGSELLAQHGTGPLWSDGVALPLATPDAKQRGTLYNNIVVMSDGRIVVATQEYHPTTGTLTGVYLVSSEDEGQTWSAPMLVEPISMLIGGANPRLARDSEDHLYVLFTAKVPAGIFCSKYDSELTLLIDTARVSPAFQYTHWAPHLTVDGQNRLHAIWHEGNHKAGEQAEVYYARSIDGGQSWSAPLMLSTDDGRHSAFPRAQFEAAQGDQLAIAWRDSIGEGDWDILMARSDDGGQSWSAPQTLVASPHNDSDPDLVIDPTGRWHLFFHRYPKNDPFFGAAVWYGHSDDGGQSWSPTNWYRLSEQGKRSHLLEGNRYDLVHDRLWCTWKDERDGPASPDIMCSWSDDGGQTWAPPEFASDEGDEAVGFKAMSLFPDGRPALNYEVTVAGTDQTRVLFRQRALNATATEKITPSDSWQVYPNPVADQLWLSLPDNRTRRVRLYTCHGQLVRETQTTHPLFSLELKALPTGIYFLQVEGLGMKKLALTH